MLKNVLEYIGIDLGGTFIKGGVVNSLGEILLSKQVETQANFGADKVVDNIVALIKDLIKSSNLNKEDICGVGMGVPGVIDSKNGIAVCSHNLNFDNYEIALNVSKKTGLKVKIANDANLALLGEVLFGAGKNCKNALMLTLGTGVGGAALIEGEILEGNKSAGAEFGHSVIVVDGNQCNCGRKGCLEAYCSAQSLIKQTKKAMQEDEKSLMWQIGDIDNVNGKTAFDYANKDNKAKEVVDAYIKYLANGIINFANVFRPEVVILGGGISNQGESLFNPVQKIVDEDIFAKDNTPNVKIVGAQLGNNAAVLGSVGLFKK